MTLYDCLTQCAFALTVVVDKAGVKVGKPVFEEQIGHLLNLFDINLARSQRWQSHKAKAQFFRFHFKLLPFIALSN